MGSSIIQNLEHKYGTTKAQILKKTNGVQSIKKGLYHQRISVVKPNALLRGLEKNSHDLGPIMSPHTCITFLLKLAKRNKKEGEGSIGHVR
jgi:hypothetical protein